MIAKRFRTPKARFADRPLYRFTSDCFALKVFENKAGYDRFAAVVSTKVDKRSSRRHFWKRIVLDAASQSVVALRHEARPGQQNPHKDFLFIANPNIKKLSKAAARAELASLLEKSAQTFL